MKKTMTIWTGIFSSPSKGFTAVNEKSPLLLPLLIILILSIAAASLLIPILSSDAYTDAVVRSQINNMAEKGTEMSAEQIEAMTNSLQSGNVKKITIISSTAGAAIGYFLMLVVSLLIAKLITVIFKEKTSFKLLFRMLVYLAIITIIQMLIKNCITLITDYTRILSRVQSISDLQYALTSPLSLAVLFSPTKMNGTLYYLIDGMTDIFNWLYYIYFYFGLRYAATIEKRKSIVITILFALLSIAVGLIFTLLM